MPESPSRGRPPRDPSGAAVDVTLKLAPVHRRILDRLAKVHGSRSAVVRHLLDVAARDIPVGVEAVPQKKAARAPEVGGAAPAPSCEHRLARKEMRGPVTVLVCATCKAVKAADGMWRLP